MFFAKTAGEDGMKNLAFTLLPHGYIENDRAWNVAVPHPASVDDRKPAAEWVRVPSFSVLIRHPSAGYILYDTGSTPGDELDRRPAEARRLLPVCAQRNDYLDAQLERLGLTPKDIELVIVSHMHSDHGGGLTFFSGTKAGRNIYVPKKDFERGLVETHRSCGEFDLAYIKENFEFPGLSYNLVDEEMELAPGIELIILEGHVPAILGLILHMNSGVYIFPSDAVYSSANYGPPMRFPGIIYDTLGFERSIKRLHKLQRGLHATIIFPHDPEQYASLKQAPFFYE